MLLQKKHQRLSLMLVLVLLVNFLGTGLVFSEEVTITLDSATLTQIYDGTARVVTATTVPERPYSVTYGGSSTAPIDAGDYAVIATVTEPDTGSAAGTLTVAKAVTTTVVTVSNAVYNGSPHGGTANVTGAGDLSQSVEVIYEGINATSYEPSTTAPTNVGDYTASATYSGATNYLGSSGSKPFSITTADATITLDTATLSQTYNGATHAVTATTVPASLSYSVTYGGSPTAPTNTGDYAISAIITNPNYTATPATGTLTIAKAATTTVVTVSNAVFDGSAHGGTATVTGAGGLSQSVEVIYEGINATSYEPSTTAPTNVGDYTASATYSGATNYLGSSGSKPFSITTADATITLDTATLSQTYNGSTHVVTATTVPASLSYSVTYGGSATAPTNAGNYAIVATITEPGYSGSDTGTLIVAKAATTTVVTVSSAVYNGSAHGGTATVTGAGGLNQAVTVNYAGRNTTTYGPTTTAPTNVGDYTASATYIETTNHLGSTDSKPYSITTAAATITLDTATLSQTYNGTARVVTATTLPASLSYSVTYGGSLTAPTIAGDYAISAVITNPNYTATPATGTLTVAKAATTTVVTVSSAVYNGSAHGGTATVTGAGGLSQAVVVTYAGRNTTTYGPSTTAPTNIGDYTASAVYAGTANYFGSTDSKLFSITAAAATITLDTATLSQTYNGTARLVTATTVPASLPYSVTYGGSPTAPINAGNYAISAVITNPNYTATPATGTLTIAKAATTTVVTVSNAVFDGSAHGGTATVTGAGGLSQAVVVTYVGINATSYGPSTIAPTNVGDYTASAVYAGTTNYFGSTDSKSFSITETTAAITLDSVTLSQTYDGTARVVSATVFPTNLSYSVTYGGSATAPTNAGSYAIVAVITNPNYTSVPATGTLTVAKAATTTVVTVSNAVYNGSAHGGTATVTGAGGLSQAAVVTYAGRNTTVYGPSTVAPTNAGDYTASAAYAGTINYLGSTDSKPYSITTAAATITLDTATLSQTYNGTARVVTATTVPASLSYSVTYGGSPTTPTDAGSYAIVAIVTNPNYTAAPATGTLTISKAATTTVVTVSDAVFDGSAHGGTAAVTGAGGLSQAVVVTYAGRNTTTYGPSTTAPTNAGDYTASATYAGAINYLGSTDSKPFSITAAAATITLDTATLSQTYNGATHTVTATTVPASLSYSVTYGGSPTAPTNAGSYAIVAVITNPNYTATPATGTLTVAKAATTTVVTVSSAVYDRSAHGGTATVTGAGGLSQAVVVTYAGRNTTTYGPSTTAPTNAGDYTASATYGVTTNYLGSTDSKPYSIGQKPITVSADDLFKYRGDSDPVFTYQISIGGPLATGDTFSGTLARTQGENEGTYDILRNTLSVNDGNSGRNYNLTFESAVFTIYPPAKAFVTRFYRVFLNRDPDQGALDYWVPALVSGEQTAAELSAYFIESDDFKALNVSDVTYVRMMYLAFFDREPDSSGESIWLDQLNSGMSRYWVLVQFVNSQEFEILCRSYGMTRGSLTLTDPADLHPDITKFVNRFYKLCLSRSADWGGLNHWVDELASGRQTGANVAYGFVFSDEFKNRNVPNADYVSIMYRAFFNRDADPDGYANWMNALESGMSRYYVLAGFTNSQEFRSLAAAYGINPGNLTFSDPADLYPDITKFVTRFYQQCLNRMPDPVGLNNWVRDLQTKKQTGADVARGFVFSQEFQNRNVSNEDYVTIMYRAFFNREPDPAGYANWLGILNAGGSRYGVLAGFVNSSEFKKLCAVYNIDPGLLR